MQTLKLSAHQIDAAAALLKKGSLVAFPTETVYGLGAPVFSRKAIAALFAAKGRPADNPLIAHISCLDQVPQIAVEIPAAFEALAASFFPGPLTVVLKRHLDVPALVSAGLDTIALRMPAHPLARELIERVGQPLAAPSANLSGRPSATHWTHVLEDFDGKIAAVLDGGKTQYGLESTVVSLLGEKPIVLRPGAITAHQIATVLGCEVSAEAKDGPILSPGMKYRHYAPQKPVHLFQDLPSLLAFAQSRPAHRFFLLSRLNAELGCDHVSLCAPEYYAALRQADAGEYDAVLIYCDDEIRQDTALMNRIVRTAGVNTERDSKFGC